MEISWFKNKRVVVMGLGLHGGGRAVAQWLFQVGARVIVTDLKSGRELSVPQSMLQESCARFRTEHPTEEFFDISFHLGGHREEDFTSADMVIQNPGVPRESPYLSLAHNHTVSIENEATLFFSLTKKTPKIAITGTRGKSTTVALLGDMLTRWNNHTIIAGIATHEGAKAFFDVIETVLEHEQRGIIAPVVCELSSWQCELFECTELKATIAVVTNVLPDHLNRYENFDAYIRAKSLIFANGDEQTSVILNYDNGVTLRWGLQSTRSTRYWFTRGRGALDRGTSLSVVDEVLMLRFKDREGKSEIICRRDEITLAGEHNLENVLAAVTAAKVWGVPTDFIRESLRTFSGLPDRCETISLVGEREWINDTTATTPDATYAALKMLAVRGRNIILIAGGTDKQLDYSSLAPIIKDTVSVLILLSGSATPLLTEALQKSGCSIPTYGANTMHDAVRLAWKHSKNNDMILLSPAAASFGIFMHEFDRGQQFVQAVGRVSEI